MSTKKEVYRNTYTEDDLPGYAAIQETEKRIYGDKEPHHWATIIPYELGGGDPLWAIDCFKSQRQQKHFHYITIGFSNIYYDDELAENEVSGYGFELTFRHLPVDCDPDMPIWPPNMLQNIARYVFQSGNGFADYHYMSAGGPLRDETDTQITAIAFYTDPEMEIITTPHGEVTFLQIFGITTSEYQELRNRKYEIKALLDRHRQINPLLITDLSRLLAKKIEEVFHST